MFSLLFDVTSAFAYVKAYQEEARRFEEMCKSLPPHIAESLRAERKKQRDEKLQHQRNLEVAREGRSLNFWGNR